MIYDNTTAYAAAAYLHYQVNRFVRDFSGQRDSHPPAQNAGSLGQGAVVESMNVHTEVPIFDTIVFPRNNPAEAQQSCHNRENLIL
jgi:hypothetical protein